jgi:hypothetical protein
MCMQEGQLCDVTHMHVNLEFKKAIIIKPSIKIKFRLHHCLSYDKILKTKPHLPMFARILKIFF